MTSTAFAPPAIKMIQNARHASDTVELKTATKGICGSVWTAKAPERLSLVAILNSWSRQ